MMMSCPTLSRVSSKAQLQLDFCCSAVPEHNWITMHWLDVSCEQNYPFRNIPRDRVLCRPLPHKLPLPGFENVR